MFTSGELIDSAYSIVLGTWPNSLSAESLTSQSYVNSHSKMTNVDHRD